MVETVGAKLNDLLSNKIMWRKEHCGRMECIPCRTKPGSCRARNVTYSIECPKCDHVYFGESHRTWHDRAREHGDAVRLGDQKNPLVKHQILHQPEEGGPLEFKFKLDKKWRSSLQRQIREAIFIQGYDQDKLMNSRAE